MSYEYDRYLMEHRRGVENAFIWLQDNLPKVVGDTSSFNTIYAHDESKNYEDEYNAYDKYFYGGNRSYKVVQEFNKAWVLHIHRNPHHWQYWVLIKDDPNEQTEALDMPYEYIIEMICDWWSFSFKKGNLYEIFNWYESHKDYIMLSDRTRNIVESVLEQIKNKLEENNNEKQEQ